MKKRRGEGEEGEDNTIRNALDFCFEEKATGAGEEVVVFAVEKKK